MTKSKPKLSSSHNISYQILINLLKSDSSIRIKKLDTRIENLEWVTKPAPKAPLKAEYLEELPKNAIKIDSFNDITFNDYHFDPESKHVIQTNASKSKSKIKLIKPSVSNKRNIIVIKDSDEKRRTIDYDKLVAHFSSEYSE
jgi:hypothetical protein